MVLVSKILKLHLTLLEKMTKAFKTRITTKLRIIRKMEEVELHRKMMIVLTLMDKTSKVTMVSHLTTV